MCLSAGKMFVCHGLLTCFLAVVVGLPTSASTSEREINLLCTGDFKPVMMHGRPSAAYGWWLFDWARVNHQKRTRKYLSGEGCFELAFQDGAMIVSFPAPLNPAYVKQRMEFRSCVSQPVPPAPQYLASGRVKFDKGKFVLGNGKRLRPQAGWQSFELKTPRSFDKFTIWPEAGATFSVVDLKCLAVYPKTGGEINLPGGGKLARLLIPENASYLMRWSIALWRGWLWKITGVALPIEKVKTITPAAGAFAAIPGTTASGGWNLQVNRNGIVLTYGEELAIAPALFDFLRGLGYAYYASDCVVELKSDPQRVLPLIDKQVRPRFRYYNAECVKAAYMSGGLYRSNIYAGNAVDWFHFPLGASCWCHILNIAMPQETYYGPHPEYYMMDRNGKRVINNEANRTNPCLSNPDAMRLCADNLIAFALNQPPHPDMNFCIGDESGHCLCPDCVRANHGKDSYSDLMMTLLNKVAAGIAKKRPGMKVLYTPYASWHKPPVAVKPAKNIACLYALQHPVIPCTLHVDCEMNRNGYKELAEWSKLVGGRDNTGILTYRDMRPLHHLKQMKLVNRYAARELYIFYWKGYSPAIPFVTARWNLGEDPDKLVKEFNDHYCGKGGKYITEIDYLVEDYAAAYKHSPRELKSVGKHLGVWTEDFNYPTLLNREIFDRIYVIFDQALAAAGNTDKIARRHILQEKGFYLREDLAKYRRSSCAGDAELKAFIKRLVDFIMIAREVPKFQRNAIRNVPGRDFLTTVAGLTIPDTGKKWPLEPALDKLIANPDPAAFTLEPVKIPCGRHFDPVIFRGGTGVKRYSYNCPPKTASGIRRPSCGQNKLILPLSLEQEITEPAMLILEGIDDDKPGVSSFKVVVNGKELFSGPNPFPEKNWGKMTIGIPGGVLRAGKNRIELLNTTPDLPSRSDKFKEDQEKGKRDPYWGWIMFSGADLMIPNDKFKQFVSGEEASGWQQITGKKAAPLGKVEVKNGKLRLTGTTAEWTGIIFKWRNHKTPKIAVTPGMKLRFTVRASGKGELLAGFFAYSAEEKGLLGWPLVKFKLNGKPEVYSGIIRIRGRINFIVPLLMVKGPGQAEIEEYKMEILP
ncbi:MAG: DUF4838 domain-containing protein [Victivallales bacterium]|nr:DUF4838 domain-containing protein [Victivallales bacterium]